MGNLANPEEMKEVDRMLQSITDPNKRPSRSSLTPAPTHPEDAIPEPEKELTK